MATAVRDGFGDLSRNVETVMLVPVMGSPPRYLLLVEEGSDEYADKLAERLDVRLSEMNCEYEDRIRTRRLLPISRHVIPTGSWNRLREKKIASRGGNQEQYKHTFLGTPDEVVRELDLQLSEQWQDV